VLGTRGIGLEFVRIPLEIRTFYSFIPSSFPHKIQKILKIYNLFEKKWENVGSGTDHNM
tara:strand:- start:568 stop:744 length:177 start_codon:yes stop_codon:yes gene_type:complete